MQFSKVIGKGDDKVINQAEEMLTSVFIELATSYSNTSVGSGMGGDPFIFSLLYPMEHIATFNMPTAATDGKRYYWNPNFVIKQSRIGLRIIAYHEAAHAIYMHPQRRGSRLPKLWNIAVDYIVNGSAMDDFKARNFNPDEMFQKHLGNFITLEKYAEMLKDPWNNKGPGSDVTPPDIKLPAPGEDRELTEEEQKALDEYEKKVKCFFADSNLPENMKDPARIYDYLYSMLPKCETCGRVGVYKKPSDQQNGNDQQSGGKGKGKNGKDKSEGNSPGKGKGKSKKGNSNQQDQGDQQDQSDQGDCCDDQSCGNDQGHSHGNSDHQCDCPDCCGGYDVFGFGDTMDDHLDTEESEEKLAKRISEAAEAAKKMAGHVPAGIEAEIGKLTEPKITWTDAIRGQIARSRAGNDRNDWTRFRSRPLFGGMLIPKRKNYQANFAGLVDCSGSMSKEDIAFGLSQLKSLDSRSEGVLVPADSAIYYEKATKIRACSDEELLKFKVVGRGGTMFADFFRDYEKELGKQDFLIIISDGYLLDVDVAEMQDPGIPVYWIITNDHGFRAPFGKTFSLRQ